MRLAVVLTKNEARCAPPVDGFVVKTERQGKKMMSTSPQIQKSHHHYALLVLLDIYQSLSHHRHELMQLLKVECWKGRKEGE